MPQIAIIIVHWKGLEDTLCCIDSLEFASRFHAHILLVNNGSSDDLQSAVPYSSHIHILNLKRNMGFTGGINAGIREAYKEGADYLWLLNNDTVCAPGTLDKLIRAVKNYPFYDILTPLILHNEGKTPWFAGSFLDCNTLAATHEWRLWPIAEQITELPWITGCAPFLHRSALERIGFFDERFYLKWEDVDFSIRARELGFHMGLLADAVICHKVGGSFHTDGRAARYYHIRNHLLLIRLHLPDCSAAVYTHLSWKYFRDSLSAFRHGIPYRSSISPYLHAINDFRQNQFGKWRLD
jgi:GT2 family glycosyltransferase